MSEIEKLTYPVLSAIRHNGELYTPKDRNQIDLTKDEAATLLKLGAIGEANSEELTSEDTETVASKSEPPTGDERKDLICEAISGLDPEKDFTQGGTPKVKAVEEATGFDVTGQEVAALWEAMNANA